MNTALRLRWAVLVWVGVGWSLIAPAQTDEAQALEAVRREIQALERRLTRQHAERERGYQGLKQVERSVAEAATALAELRARAREERQRQATLGRDSAAAQARLVDERAALAQQVRLSFMTGRQEMIKLLLNQQSSAMLGRMLVYYDYMNRARSARVQAVSAELRTVARLAEETEGLARELAQLERAQLGEVERLNAARDERRELLAKLDTDIERSGSEIGRLQSEADRLAELVAELEAVMEALPLGSEAAFGSITGELPWPVSGALLGDYGQPRPGGGGQLKWNGVLLGAPAGTAVRAVYHGRVAYADWLPGLGLLVIVDHGVGYMSLYGHNEAILKEAGAWVTLGEVIALVGDSGGQGEAALYFEIRREGMPVDPHRWLRSQ